MSDEVDRANELSEVLLAASIRNASEQLTPKYPPKGRCYNCDEPLAAGHRWCDASCQSDFMHRELRRNRA